ncbi:MAG: class I SAM-dependent methyltransferase [Hyphomicrobiaceae bacterium]|nr:class I SAM-dependent methyltransferase [Hyphomicrobiaceae bacterium]
MTSDISDHSRPAAASFVERQASIDLFLAAVSAELAAHPVRRLLDLGCGTGALTLALAERFPDMEIVGLDISAPNIAEADRRLALAGYGGRVSFVAADFFSWQGPLFDAIVTDGVLHLIPATDAALFEKLAHHVAPGGYTLITMPVADTGNAARVGLRKVWRAMPKALDEVALSVAQRVYPKESREVLRDRVGYLRVLPERLWGTALQATAERAGLVVERQSSWPNPSVMKLQHGLIKLRRAGSAGAD